MKRNHFKENLALEVAEQQLQVVQRNLITSEEPVMLRTKFKAAIVKSAIYFAEVFITVE